MRRYGGVWRIADGVDDSDVFVRQFLAEIHHELAGFSFDVAHHMRVFVRKLYKRVNGDVANCDEIVL